MLQALNYFLQWHIENENQLFQIEMQIGFILALKSSICQIYFEIIILRHKPNQSDKPKIRKRKGTPMKDWKKKKTFEPVNLLFFSLFPSISLITTMSSTDAAAAAAVNEKNLQKDPVTGEMISKSYVNCH